MQIITIFAVVIFVAIFLPSSNANPLHIVVARESDEGVAAPRRILMSDGNVLLNFTNDDSRAMVHCEMSQDAAVIERLLSVRYNRNANDVMNERRMFNDHDGSRFAVWTHACARANEDSWVGILRAQRSFYLLAWAVFF